MIKIGKSKELVKKPEAIKVCEGLFNKLEITKDTKKLLDYALEGRELSNKEVETANNTATTFMTGVGIHNLKTISDCLTQLDNLQVKLLSKVNEDKTTLSQLLRVSEFFMLKLDKAMENFKNREDTGALFQVYSDNRNISINSNNKENVSENKNYIEDAMPRDTRMKLQRVVDGILNGEELNKTIT